MSKFITFRQWENPLAGKYCLAYITRDLFGNWHMIKTWGRVGKPAPERLISTPCSSQEEALYIFQLTHRKRLQSGYQTVDAGAIAYA